jgi:hypothetical protein
MDMASMHNSPKKINGAASDDKRGESFGGTM